jgi:hypothetical protein
MHVRVSDLALGFVRAMMALHRDDFDVAYFLDKPHKWEEDFARWCRHGMPADDSAATWDRWANEELRAANADAEAR